jgi:ATP-binding cassette subfamily F protein 3
MLDEPTNHLDMHSCELLIEALNKYQGSFILVSHDRYFISKTANKIWEIVDHKIKEFKGGYEEWVEWKERMQKSEAGDQKSEKSKKINESKKEERVPLVKPQPQPPINKDLKKELQKQQKLLHQLEEKIGILNKQKAEYEEKLYSPATYADKNKFIETETMYKKVSGELSNLSAEYEKLFEKVMELESKV